MLDHGQISKKICMQSLKTNRDRMCHANKWAFSRCRSAYDYPSNITVYSNTAWFLHGTVAMSVQLPCQCGAELDSLSAGHRSLVSLLSGLCCSCSVLLDTRRLKPPTPAWPWSRRPLLLPMCMMIGTCRLSSG